jgi:hypothetical protein
MEDGFLKVAELEAGGCGVGVQIDRELIERGELISRRILDLLQTLQPLCTTSTRPGQPTTRRETRQMIGKGSSTIR